MSIYPGVVIRRDPKPLLPRGPTHQRLPAGALSWYRELKQAVLNLDEQPMPVTPGNKNLPHLLYGHKPHIYCAIYRGIETYKKVEVLHIRHGARPMMPPKALT